jgi:hypothetical protein
MSRVQPPRHSPTVISVGFAMVVTLALAACAAGTDVGQITPGSPLEARVAAAIVNATDLPTDAFSIAANGGVVTITGSVVCEDCGGMQTPGGLQSIQQSLGAVVRAVPGVERVEFELGYR